MDNTDLPLAPTQVDAIHSTVRRLGHWTTARRFTVRARRSLLVLDLRSPAIPAGDIGIDLDVDHSTVKVLVPETAAIDEFDLELIDRGRVKQTFHHYRLDAERLIRLTGRVRHGEVRVLSGGPAQVAAIFTREFFADARQANALGKTPTVHDPAVRH